MSLIDSPRGASSAPRILNPVKRCPSCTETLPLDAFYKKAGGYAAHYCKPCAAEHLKEWKAKNPDNVKASSHKYYLLHKAYIDKRNKEYYENNKDRAKVWSKRHYLVRRMKELPQKFGITAAEYDARLKAQGGLCAICKQADRTRALAIDHDHITKTVRGLLCKQCNMALGLLKDDCNLLQTAIAYLKG